MKTEDQNEISRALARMEESLQNVDSARKQVEDVLAAFSQISDSIGDYSGALSSVTQTLNILIDNIKKNKADYVSGLEENVLSKFRSLDAAILAFDERTRKSQKQFDKSRRENLEQMASDTKDSIGSLKSSLQSVSVDFDKSVSDALSELEKSNGLLCDAVVECRKTTDAARDIADRFSDRLDEFSASLDKAARQQKSLSYLTIAGFVVLVLLMLLMRFAV